MIIGLLIVFGVPVSLFCIFFSLILLCVATTLSGVIFAVNGVIIGLLPITFILILKKNIRAQNFIYLTLLLFIGFSFIMYRAPNGKNSANSRIQNHYVGNKWNYQKFALSNFLPEIDQFMFGFQIVPGLDPFFTKTQGKNMSIWTSRIYKDLESDQDFQSLGSNMPEVYDEILDKNFKHGHYFLYIPKGADSAKSLPALVFLHGSGGNFKAYMWLLSEIAENLKIVLIAPSYGFGNWRMPDTEVVTKNAIEDSLKYANIDLKNIHLMGLSNGGLGVSQLAASANTQFRSLIYLSPVIANTAIRNNQFIKNWKDRPIFIMSGKEDDRIPIKYVKESAEIMKSNGANVKLSVFENSNHFLFFSHDKEVIESLSSWIKLNY